MQNFFIKTENGLPINHPATEDNLRVFYPDLDPSNPPEGWARFVRLPLPTIKFSELLEKTTYELNNFFSAELGTPTYTDLYHIRTLTTEEIDQKCQQIFGLSLAQLGESFSVEEGTWVPNKPKPDDGKEYTWIGFMDDWVDASYVAEASSQSVNPNDSVVLFKSSKD